MSNTPNLSLIYDAMVHHAREIDTSHRYTVPGYALSEIDIPEPVGLARTFHTDILGHGEFGDVVIHRLPDEMGILLVAHHSESRWGLVEVYSLAGEIVASGVYSARAFAWCTFQEARTAAQNLLMPLHLFPKTTSIEWIEHGTGAGTAFESVGGRFMIIPPKPYGDRDAYVLNDWTNNSQYPFTTPEEAKAHAEVIQSGA